LLKVASPSKQIEELLLRRFPYYRQADYIVDTEGVTPDEVAEKILDIIKRKTD
jgi:shikimate kinase